MAFCSRCGNQVQDGTPFCSSCGAPMGTQNSNQGGYYGQQQGNGAPGGQGYQYNMANITPVKTDRSLLMYILLTIVTCGIYSYYFVYTLAKDVNQMCEGDGETVGGLAAYILLSFITCGFYSWYWLYKIQNRLHGAAPRYGVVVNENGTTVLLWMVIGSLLCGIGSFIGMNIVIVSANKVGVMYNARHFNIGVR